MKGYLSNENGEIIIENEVIAQYAGHAALECFGIVGMATISMKDGIAKLLKGDSISKGVNVVIGENNELVRLREPKQMVKKQHIDMLFFLCYGDEENARIYAVRLTTANQSKMRRYDKFMELHSR